jgi:hypothetical protein
MKVSRVAAVYRPSKGFVEISALGFVINGTVNLKSDDFIDGGLYELSYSEEIETRQVKDIYPENIKFIAMATEPDLATKKRFNIR